MGLRETALQEDLAVLHEHIQRLPQEAFDDRSELSHVRE
jgi:hypothetical protein